MLIIGMDYHPSFEQIACVDTETGEFQEHRLQHREGAEKFYRDLAMRGVQVRIGWKPVGGCDGLSRPLAGTESRVVGWRHPLRSAPTNWHE